MKKYLPFLLILTAFIWSCRRPEKVAEEFLPTDSHEEYAEALTALELEDTAMGRQWLTAGDPSSNPTALSLLPFQERRKFDPAVPDAAYYLIEGLRGQVISIDIETDSKAGYFADLFGLDSEFYPEGSPEEGWENRAFDKVAAAAHTEAETANPKAAGGADRSSDPGADSALTGSSRLVLEPRTHRFYLLRLQPRLLEEAEFIITFNSGPLLSWPLPDSDTRDVKSFFGASRDGGDRVHHGIDIFAPRGTPVLAVDNTSIYRVQIRERGGNTVFLRDEERGLIYYYAHLDEWAEDIEALMMVPEGKELGTVGNTGNAGWSPPHLHFGIYQTSWRSALDPWYFFIEVEDLPENRQAVPLPTESRFPPAGSAAFYRKYASRSLFVPSPSVRDRYGRELGNRGKPVMVQEWGPEYPGNTGDLRLVASRSKALGFIDRERRIWWMPYNPS